MPKICVKIGHGLKDVVIDVTDFRFQHASKFELNSLMFLNYENTQTGKELVGISPHGRQIIFTQVQFMIPNLLKNVVQFVLLKLSMKL